MLKALGKLSKKLSTIDLAFGIILVVVVSFMLYHWLNREASQVYVDLTYPRQEWSEESYPPEFWQVDSLSVGDFGYNSLGKKVAEVIEVETIPWHGGARKYVRVTLKLKTTYNATSQIHTFDGTPLIIGQELSLILGNTLFTGLIQNVYQDPSQKLAKLQLAKAEIVVKYRDLEPWHAEKLRHFQVENSSGEILVQTKNIVISPAEKSVATNRGDLVRRLDPIKKDVTLTLEIPRVVCSGQTCYYNYTQALLVGEEFWAFSKDTWVGEGSIMDVSIDYEN